VPGADVPGAFASKLGRGELKAWLRETTPADGGPADWPPFPVGSVYEGWAASHLAELWYVFDHLDQEPWHWSMADSESGRGNVQLRVNFARSGNPNGPGLPSWPAFTNAENKVLYLGDPITVGGVANIKSLNVLDALYTNVRGTPFASR
jgi:para-nitrobenzyl esterase